MIYYTAEEYLNHHYEIPDNFPILPLNNENFLNDWSVHQGQSAIDFLSNLYSKPFDFNWNNIDDIKISFSQTLAGQLPVIDTSNHDDFEAMSSLLSNQPQIKKLPASVNAFTIPAIINDNKHRMILLNKAPYSNVSADILNLSPDDWLDKSHKLRLRHESAHYETLRLFGSMQNHALDEILADALGQIAAFGNFSAQRQRIFFGLHDDNSCDGRLTFYTQKILPDERNSVYPIINNVLDSIELEINGKSDIDILRLIANLSILSRVRSFNDV